MWAGNVASDLSSISFYKKYIMLALVFSSLKILTKFKILELVNFTTFDDPGSIEINLKRVRSKVANFEIAVRVVHFCAVGVVKFQIFGYPRWDYIWMLSDIKVALVCFLWAIKTQNTSTLWISEWSHLNFVWLHATFDSGMTFSTTKLLHWNQELKIIENWIPPLFCSPNHAAIVVLLPKSCFLLRCCEITN